MWEVWKFSSTALDLGAGWCDWWSSHSACLTAGVRTPSSHWIGGWVGPRARLDAVKKKISHPSQELYSSCPVHSHFLYWWVAWLLEKCSVLPSNDLRRKQKYFVWKILLAKDQHSWFCLFRILYELISHDPVSFIEAFVLQVPWAGLVSSMWGLT
jgi:hypothetical protein